MRLLVIRTSAMGDVALTAPVIQGMRQQFPDVELMLLTKEAFKPFFSSITGLLLFHPDYNNRHKGLLGLIRLYKEVRNQGKINHVIDLHNVLRSKIIRILFRLNGVPVSVINKGRKERKQVINGKRKIQLQHSIERYCDVFVKAGYHVIPSGSPWIVPSTEAIFKTGKIIDPTRGLNIGVAPYAKHDLKVWPEGNMIRLLRLISEKYKSRFWLFGGKDESEKLVAFQTRVSDSTFVKDTLSLDDELAYMSKLDFMIVMDSSNMHMAALVGTKVISIWGGTDPLIGFGAWMQPEDFSIRIPTNELTCRPCTIYGKGECRRGDLACLNWLTPEMVFQIIEDLHLLNNGNKVQKI